MAELATLARPYAEALFDVASKGDLAAVTQQVNALAAVTSDDQLRQFADSPKVDNAQVFDLIKSVVPVALSTSVENLLRAIIDNGRLTVLPEIAAQFHTLANKGAGVSDATVYSAFPIEAGRLADVVSTLERRFRRKLNATVAIEPDLIGGIRVVVGDEVLDTSVRARLEQMKSSLTA
jgi:F-type H+-transporting ATPase subunit delta